VSLTVHQFLSTLQRNQNEVQGKVQYYTIRIVNWIKSEEQSIHLIPAFCQWKLVSYTRVRCAFNWDIRIQLRAATKQSLLAYIASVHRRILICTERRFVANTVSTPQDINPTLVRSAYYITISVIK